MIFGDDRVAVEATVEPVGDLGDAPGELLAHAVELKLDFVSGAEMSEVEAAEPFSAEALESSMPDLEVEFRWRSRQINPLITGNPNAGGVAVPGLEMAQNSMRYSWTREEVDNRLQMIMKDIHTATVDAANRFGTPGNYVNGANIAGFLKVANAMLDQGVV